MASSRDIVRFLNRELDIRKIPDSSRNGLQVNGGKKEIKKAGFAVDACLSTFEKAKKEGVDLLVVHHGLRWKPQKHRKIEGMREDFLKKNRISLYAAHLPLDLHHTYGNNIGLCRILNLVKTRKFGRYHGFKIGYSGRFRKPAGIRKVAGLLNKRLRTRCMVFPFGKKRVRSMGIVSGGGSDAIEDAVKDNIDCLLVGEINLGAYQRARDFRLSMIVAGHYATETQGVKALMDLLKQKFNIKTIFIENPTGL